MIDEDTKQLMEEKYKQFFKLLCDTCHKFKYKYGGDVDEYISHANTIFIRAFNEWDEETATIAESTHYRSWIHMSLLDIYRPIWTRSTKYGAVLEQEHLEAIPERKKAPFIDYEEMQHKLTKDGLLLLKLILNAPPELQKIIDGKGGTPRNYRSSVKDYLKKHYRWNQQRVVEAFEDLGYELFGRPEKSNNATTTQSSGRTSHDVARQGVFKVFA